MSQAKLTDLPESPLDFVEAAKDGGPGDTDGVSEGVNCILMNLLVSIQERKEIKMIDCRGKSYLYTFKYLQQADLLVVQ